MLISLRGTNGSGKTTVIRALLKAAKTQRNIYKVLGNRLPEAYELVIPKVKKPVYILGPYHLTDCGGCDRLIPFDIIPPLIASYEKQGHVVFEGVIVSSVYGQIGALMEKYKKKSVMLFLDTPLKECIRRVQDRRDGREDDRVFDPKNLTMKFNATIRVKERALVDGIIRVETASSVTAHNKIVEILREG